jgi:hypothetical protein
VTAKHRPILVIGLPRSGTTWTETILGTAVGASIVSEPDNEKLSAPAIWAKRSLGRFPVLAPEDESRAYERLWKWALAGAPSSMGLRLAAHLVERNDPRQSEKLVKGRPSFEQRLAAVLGSLPGSTGSSEIVVAKSVHACLAIDWIAARFDVDVLVVLRHPANVLSSWLELDLPDRDRDLGASKEVRRRFLNAWGVPLAGTGVTERAAWQVGVLTAALEGSAQMHPHWLVCTHEQLCSDPEREFRNLFAELGLSWGATTSKLLEQGDNPGAGFSLNRKSSELAESWRDRLDPKQLGTLARVLRPFPLKTWDPADLLSRVNGDTDWLDPRVLRYHGRS